MNNLQKQARDYIETTDAIVRDLDIPVMQEALDLQDKVFAIADRLGVGSEVRTIVYTVRSFEYAGAVVGPLVPAYAAGAGAGVMIGIGGVAALGIVGAVVGVVASIFSSDDDEERRYRRIKRAQAHVLAFRDRLSLEGFAAEQDEAAHTAKVLAGITDGKEHARFRADEERARKLARFYRAASSELSPADRATFESVSNLARWEHLLTNYKELPWRQRDAVDVMFGKSAPRLPWQLKAPLSKERKWLAADLLRRKKKPQIKLSKPRMKLTFPKAVVAAMRPPPIRPGLFGRWARELEWLGVT